MASVLSRHAPPGNLPELSEANKDKWSKDFISHWMQGEIDANPDVVSKDRTKLTQFFDATKTASDQRKPKAVTWNAFPNLLVDSYPGVELQNQIADSSRVVQDEYLEWSVSRGERKYSGDIHSVSFTCEGPEYWQFLASAQKPDFIKLMRSLNSGFDKEMDNRDFFLKDHVSGNEVYNPANPWNLLSTTGTIAHLIQPNNTLSAEIDIAAQATVIRKDDKGRTIEDKDDLIKCSKYGNRGRNSDPRVSNLVGRFFQGTDIIQIGAGINFFARKGASLTVADPVAIYIHDFDKSNFKFDINSTTDGQALNLQDIEEPDRVFQWQRGDITKNQGLRIKIEVPKDLKQKNKDGEPLLVSNIYDTLNKKHIRYGAQFARYFTMSVSAVAIPGKTAEAQPCYRTSAAAGEKAPCAEFDGFPHPGISGTPGSSRA
ncbi:hypothetical protein NUU61_008242 [Penicillium alfredii]|uniref:Uncharacterized protein n=1 Tax=Penicillium alfredii TaxID=1506179 RepID=A0A9W9ES73_9EURO|nr:uncharacterized protein NUU61_008242 [Penicillium alfredii]KAJ5086935.1 hypothetical protein NUU61_008242 [Penicillium alfredii]